MVFRDFGRVTDRIRSLTSERRIRSKAAALVVGTMAVWLMGIAPAQAVQSPPGCTTNDFNFNITKSAPNTINNGQTVNYAITVENGPTPACTLSDITFQSFCPDAAGASTVLTPINVVNAIPNPLPINTPTFTFGTFTCVVTVNAGVTTAQAKAAFTGNLNDLANATDPQALSKTLSVDIAQAPAPPPPPGPPPNTIPTLSGWAMILFAGFMVVLGAFMMRRKRVA